MKEQPKKAAEPKRRADQYNDPSHNYRKYWEGRDYENAAEEMAIRRLLDGKHFRHAADIGGGFGRLCLLLEQYAQSVTLTDPSQQQLDLGEEYLSGHPEIDRKLMQADDLKFKDGALDLITMIRVMHHLPDPTKEFSEISRVLADDGYAIIEVANYTHARNRIKHLLKGTKMPSEPVSLRPIARNGKDDIPFVNHNPHTVITQLAHAGLKVDRILSVSNLRSQGLKKIVPKSVMLAIEGILQPTLAKSFFGPSVFFLVKKA
ncbi:MAG TPA: class I SAM-dependent methyltransferase [Candidatus Saccharimonadales bacterium]|jgi:SAM-dependent methyltransferase|nr:class I SAM-dependent methyltransferase [Candidatus Saccharimonadales bacterium]